MSRHCPDIVQTLSRVGPELLDPESSSTVYLRYAVSGLVEHYVARRPRRLFKHGNLCTRALAEYKLRVESGASIILSPQVPS